MLFCPFPYFPSNTKTQCLFPYFDIYFRDAFDDLRLETTIRLFLCPIAPEKKLVKTNATNMFQEANGIESSEPSSASVNCSPISVPTANGDVLLECSPIFLRELTDFNGNGNLLKS